MVCPGRPNTQCGVPYWRETRRQCWIVESVSNNTDNDNNARWSPNGKKIVFLSFRDVVADIPSNRSEIYVMDADGSNVTRLTFNQTRDAHPDWSPNGKKIVFSHHVPDDDIDLPF